jgi:hypothetical protein
MFAAGFVAWIFARRRQQHARVQEPWRNGGSSCDHPRCAGEQIQRGISLSARRARACVHLCVHACTLPARLCACGAQDSGPVAPSAVAVIAADGTLLSEHQPWGSPKVVGEPPQQHSPVQLLPAHAGRHDDAPVLHRCVCVRTHTICAHTLLRCTACNTQDHYCLASTRRRTRLGLLPIRHRRVQVEAAPLALGNTQSNAAAHRV